MRTEFRVISDSITPSGSRLITGLARYATIVHQDMQTQRTIYQTYANHIGEEPSEWCEVQHSYSTNSNRAKTTKQVMYEVWRHPFCPTRFPKRATTMHGTEYHQGFQHSLRAFIWLKSRYFMMFIAWLLLRLNVHKQHANRMLIPWQWTVIVMTANSIWWDHMIRLRDHYAAQDEMQEIARAAHEAIEASPSTVLQPGSWHLPFVTPQEQQILSIEDVLSLSVARCARTSYAQSFEDMLAIAVKRPRADDIALTGRLLVMDPEHAGPLEHQAQAHEDSGHRSGNLFGWDQLRHSPTGWLMRLAAKDALRVRHVAESQHQS